MEEKIFYFDVAGIENTDATLKLSRERALKRNIKNIVLASTRGYTAEMALKIFKNTKCHLIVIPHQFGSLEGDLFDPKIKKILEKDGHEVYFSTHFFWTQRFWDKQSVPGTLINGLYRFSQGMKVCVEIILMAANAGLIRQGEDVISIGGTDIGADTAVVIRSSTSLDFDNFQVREIICKPLCSTPVKYEVVQSRTEQLKMKKFENDK